MESRVCTMPRAAYLLGRLHLEGISQRWEEPTVQQRWELRRVGLAQFGAAPG